MENMQNLEKETNQYDVSNKHTSKEQRPIKKGVLYGIGIGPGDPELLTVKAVRLLSRCPVIAAPQTRGEKTTALDIVKKAVSIEKTMILPLSFEMTKDKEKLAKNHQAAADKIMEKLADGLDVAMISLGDVSIYSTFQYIRQYVMKAGYHIEAIPGIPSFCAAAAALQVSLTEMEKPLHIIPAVHNSVADSLAYPGTKVLMKAGRCLKSLKEEIAQKHSKATAAVVINCGMEGEKIYSEINEEACGHKSYFTTVIVKEEGEL